jgi:hypothetical protein
MNATDHYQGQAALAELRRWQGIGLQPAKGCHLLELPLNDSSAWVEFEFTPGRPGRYSGPPEACYPDEPAEVVICQVLVNGTMVSVEVFSDEQIERWWQQILDAHETAAQEGELL